MTFICTELSHTSAGPLSFTQGFSLVWIIVVGFLLQPQQHNCQTHVSVLLVSTVEHLQ